MIRKIMNENDNWQNLIYIKDDIHFICIDNRVKKDNIHYFERPSEGSRSGDSVPPSPRGLNYFCKRENPILTLSEKSAVRKTCVLKKSRKRAEVFLPHIRFWRRKQSVEPTEHG